MGNKAWLVNTQLTQKDWQILSLLAFSRIYLLLVTYILSLLLQQQSWTFGEFLQSFGNQWDGPHYIYISQHGYTNIGDEANFIVFLPLYPLLLKFITFLIQTPQIAGVLLSNVIFILAGFVFYKMVNQDYSEKVATTSTLILIVFPTSYFFATSYPESLFLLLVSLSFYFAKYYLKSSIFACLATLTRPFGLVLWIPLLLEVRNSSKRIQSFFTVILFTLLSFGTYLYLNLKTYGDPLAYQKILEKHWFKSFAFPWEGIRTSWERGLNNFASTEDQIYIGLAEGLVSTLAWILVPLAFWKLKKSHAVYYLLGVLLFTSTGFILSSSRYLLSLPPFFILLGMLLNSKLKLFLWLLLSAALLLYLSVRFASGQWSF